MTKILIIGGYGTFGGHLARLLADESRLILQVAGRHLGKAKLFCSSTESRATMIPVRFDRDADVGRQLSELAPDIVVDASGPFQCYGDDAYRIVDAAVNCDADYLDLADASAFVCGIDRFDARAIDRNLFVLSGASTCPALSAAVCRHLAQPMSQINSISGGIAPSPYSRVGRSVITAIAHSAGKPLQESVDPGRTTIYPFTDTRRFTVAPPGYLPLRNRTFSVVDVPDLALLRSMIDEDGKVWIGAAPVPGIYHAILRTLARAVKIGLLPSVRPLEPLMTFVMNNLVWGEKRGGMVVEVSGRNPEQGVISRSWHLIAEGDDGPTIPSMACAGIIRRCIHGRAPAPGARPAIAELTLEDFEYFFAQKKIFAGIRESDFTGNTPVFRQVLNSAWLQLPEQIRELHDVQDTRSFSGRASVRGGSSPIAKLIGRVVGFPAESENVRVSVEMTASNGRERWSRDFDGHRFSSIISVGKGRFSFLACERFGPVSFAMALVLEDERLYYVPRGWTFLGIPMPSFLAPTGKTCEYVENGMFHFHVEIVLPVIGHVVTYKGYLAVSDQPDNAS